MFERIKYMLKKEFIQVFRDQRMKGVIFVFPVIQLLIFGYAVTIDVKNIATVVQDRDHSVFSRELVDRFIRSGYFTVVAYVDSERRAQEWLDRGEAQMVLILPKGFGAAIQSGRTAEGQLIVDGTDSNTAGIVLQYCAKIAGEFSRQVMLTQWAKVKGSIRQLPHVELEARAWFNENLVSRNYFVPGVIAIIVTLLTLMLTGMAVVREKEIGTMEQIIVTPITPLEFILGKTVPFALIAILEGVAVTVVGVSWFEVPIRGSLLLLFFCTLLYLLTTLGVGLLISTVSRTQQQAMMTTFFFFMPTLLLSGLIFPIANMPETIQWLTFLNPMRYFLVIIRGIFLKGLGADTLWPHMAALATIGFFILWFTSRRFKKTLA
jgi:ABC-2 type transport system permease protein